MFTGGQHSTNIGHIRNIRRLCALLACALLASLAGPAAFATEASASAHSKLAAFPSTTVKFVGYGDGFGTGMGQWGAFGYAALDHKSYKWILTHYYGGTTFSASDNLVSSDPTISVDLTANGGHPVVVTSQSAFSFGGYSFTGGQAVRAVLSSGRWTLSEAEGCSATTWVPVASNLVNPVAEPSSLLASASESQVLVACEHNGTDLAVRGTIEAYAALSGAVTLNYLPIEEYVRSVLVGEVPWSWGLFGGSSGSPQSHPWGFQALEAQAVAARSYVAAELAAGGWKSYATVCDAGCQSYAGMANENTILDAATADTTGQIVGQTNKTTHEFTPTFAQYSASTGGYTSGASFPVVVDAGDSVCIKSGYFTCNPCHEWNASLSVSLMDKDFKLAGKLATVEVMRRNGVGALGGRVEAVELLSTTGAKLQVSIYKLEALLEANNPYGCVSDWYGVTNGS